MQQLQKIVTITMKKIIVPITIPAIDPTLRLYYIQLELEHKFNVE